MGAAYAWAQRSGSPSALSVIDVAVIDRNGDAVRDLIPSDFSVVTANQPRAVSAFAAVDASAGTARDAAPTPLPLKLDPGELHRAFAVIVDDAGISADAAADLRAALSQFIEKQTGPRDTVALFRTSSGSSTFEQLTADRRLLTAAIGQISFNPAAHPPSASSWPEILGYALGGLRAIEGRKAVALFCGEAPTPCASASMARSANRAWASVYGVTDGSRPACLADLADRTGGLMLAGSPAEALARIAADQAGYYLIGFAPASPENPPFSIKVSRPGLNVRARQGLPGITAPASFERGLSPQVELRGIMASPLTAGSMRLRVSAGFRRTNITNIIDVALLIDGRDISLTRRLDGTYQGNLDIAIRIFDAAGAPVQDHADTGRLNGDDAERLRLLDAGLPIAIPLAVGKPGVYHVHAGVRDATSSNTGLCHTLVEVPDVSKHVLLVSGIRLVPGEMADATDESQGIDSVRRTFRPGEPFSYSCAIYNLQPDDHGLAHLEVVAAIYSEGRPVYRGAPSTVTAADAASKSWLTLRGKLQLGAQTVPGPFVLQVIVTDKVKSVTASQWIDFTLR
jgi:hypothetical protein